MLIFEVTSSSCSIFVIFAIANFKLSKHLRKISLLPQTFKQSSWFFIGIIESLPMIDVVILVKDRILLHS